MKIHRRMGMLIKILTIVVFVLPSLSRQLRPAPGDLQADWGTQGRGQSSVQSPRPGRAGAPAVPDAQAAAVPADLNSLLTPHQSEMRLVTLRYNADRMTLNGNYDGTGNRRGGGRGGSPAPAPVLSLSTARIARLKRFDIDWQATLEKIDATRLSAAAQSELAELKGAVQANLAQLDRDAAALAEVLPLLPFARSIVSLSEARIRMEDVDSRRAAGVLAEIPSQIDQIKKRLHEDPASSAAGPGSIRAGKDLVLRAADSTENLRSSLTTWFNFYNGYDPLFTWWMGLPYKHANDALQTYSAFLQETASIADSQPGPAPPPLMIEPSPAPPGGEVPDLAELMALPQDEMIEVVRQFQARPGGGRGRGAGNAAEERDAKYYDAWLAALKTLDFERLSRNAQVDYLFIRATCEKEIARAGQEPQTDIPRKTDESGITGAVRGRVGLLRDLQDEMIPYTPEELIAIAEREFAWCDEERSKAAQQMGFRDDWQAALEKVKEMHVPPGGQPAVVRDLMFEAIDYLRVQDLITIPPVASESLHMIMMTPERQLVNPFFTGGSEISVSYPTDTMEYEARLQSMRGNSIPLSHATAFHEMIPGHNFVGYMSSRYAGYRARLSNTSFYGEGWPLYWELTMYDKGFHDTPEEKIGALFWRMHRCARIIFSLRFHMGEWSPQECIDFLVDRVGFERENAAGEVRRSFQGGYGPLYQAAYLLGGLQLRALRRELVDSGRMQEKEFHDEVLRHGSMPITMLRLAMTKQRLTRDMDVTWKFYGNATPR